MQQKLGIRIRPIAVIRQPDRPCPVLIGYSLHIGQNTAPKPVTPAGRENTACNRI